MRHHKKAGLVLAIILIIAMIPVFLNLRLSDILDISQGSLIIVAIIIVGLYCLKTFVWVIPQTFLYISAGAVFPVIWALIITYLGILCTLCIGFLAGRLWGHEKVLTFIEKNNAAKRLLLREGSIKPLLCLIIRFFPLPIGLVNIFFGASAVKFVHFIAFSLLGMTPSVAAFVLLGNSVSLLPF